MTKTAYERIKAGLLDAIDYVEGRRTRGFRARHLSPAEIKAARKRLATSDSSGRRRAAMPAKPDA